MPSGRALDLPDHKTNLVYQILRESNPIQTFNTMLILRF